MRRWYTAIALLFFSITLTAQEGDLQLALLQYRGGGDWYADPTALPNIARFVNDNLTMQLQEDYAVVEAASPELFNYPFVHITGHGNILFSDEEADNIRRYLLSGGFLYIDDNYGLDKFIRPAMKKVFPSLAFVELPFDHPIYQQPYLFTNGLPKIHAHDGKAPQGFGLIHEGRLICYYTYETDITDGWEDASVHNNTPEKRQQALQMGANIIQYAFTR